MTVTGSRAVLPLAAIAVAFAAADTYVVVMALPEMLTATGGSLDNLHQAAPIVSGFLLGYVAMLPLIGRLSDVRGRLPVLLGCLIVFALGSALTAVAYDMTTMVAGRFWQGVGGGGLIPATLALVADRYPPERRGTPLGIVSAVQEIGSVLGPLFGAAVLAVASWRGIFVLNVVLASCLALALWWVTRSPTGSRPDLVGGVLALASLTAIAGVCQPPDALKSDLFWGQLYVPFVSGSRWLTPLGISAMVAVAALLAWCLAKPGRLVDVRGWWHTLRRADLRGATLLGLALAGVIAAFATADPKVAVFSDNGLLYLAASAAFSLAFVVHTRRTPDGLIPKAALSATPAWGSLLVSFFVGAALIAALVDVPLFARTTVYPDSQFDAALVLVRLLAALPVGAVVGGWACRHVPPGVVTAGGLSLTALGFVMMSRWDADSLTQVVGPTVALVACGAGFGLALAPVNVAMLAHTTDNVHGVASAFVVVARMIGMLVGISALTTIGLARYYAETGAPPDIRDVCDGATSCEAFNELLREAAIAQEQTVFAAAAGCAAAGAVLALVLFRTVAKTAGGRPSAALLG